jgi:hypothetical protein
MNQEQIVDLCREHSFFTWSVQSQVQPLTAVKGEGVRVSISGTPTANRISIFRRSS